MSDQPEPLAGQEIKLTAGSIAETLRVEDWNDRVFGQSWMDMAGHPASLSYAMRSAMAGLPLDNEVVYGKAQGLGHLVHVSEFATDEAPGSCPDCGESVNCGSHDPEGR